MLTYMLAWMLVYKGTYLKIFDDFINMFWNRGSFTPPNIFLICYVRKASQMFNYKTFFDVSKVYEAMFERRVKITQFKSPEYSETRPRLVEYIYGIGKIFNITKNTL